MKLAFLLITFLAVVLFVALAQRLGWINLRASGSGVTAGMAQMGQFVDPPTKHVVEVKQAKTPADAPGDHRRYDVFNASPSAGGRTVIRTALVALLFPAVVAAQGIVTPYKPPVIPPGSPGSIRPLPGGPFPHLPPLPGLYPVPGVIWYPWYWQQPQPVVVVNVPVLAAVAPPRTPDMPSTAFAELPATLKLQFPAPAEVWLDGVKLAGPVTDTREIASVPLKLGAEHTFSVKARWTLAGTNYEVERTSTVPAGGSKKLLIVSGTPIK